MHYYFTLYIIMDEVGMAPRCNTLCTMSCNSSWQRVDLDIFLSPHSALEVCII